ncbi:MAG: FUSC family protein [Chlamydiota bacterium]
MMVDQHSLQNAFKLALSIALSYWFSLLMDWDLPKYSALAVLLISLDTTAASLKKGLMRIIGTIVGVFFGFFFLAYFSQDRMETMIIQATFLFMVSYGMQASKYPYAWFVAGFTPFLVWSNSYMHVNDAFYFGLYRFIETSTGIAIYTIVSALPWPNDHSTLSKSINKNSINKELICFKINQEYLVNSLITSLTYLVGFIFWIYSDPPGGAAVVSLTVIYSLMILLNSLEPGKLLIWLTMSMWLVAAPFYFILMPKMDTGFELITALFTCSMFFGYLGSISPVLKLAPLIMLIMSTGISNQQSYSFISFINTSMATILSISIVLIIKLIIPSPDKPKLIER